MRWGWIVIGASVGAAAWIAPLINEVTGHPGNLTLLWRATHRHVATLGTDKALGALSANTRLLPAWISSRPTHNALAAYFYPFRVLGGSAWWGVTLLFLLALIAGVAWKANHVALASLAFVSLLSGVALTATISGYPKSQFLQFNYLEAFVIPVGMAALVTLVWAGIEVVRIAGRWVLASSAASWWRSVGVPLGAGGLLLLASGLSVATAVPEASSGLMLDPRLAANVVGCARAVEQRHVTRPFILAVHTENAEVVLATSLAIGYQLRVAGLEPELANWKLAGVGASAAVAPHASIASMQFPHCSREYHASQ